jgi:hypothetical protein
MGYVGGAAMSKKTLWAFVLVAMVSFCGLAVAASEPTLHQVYQAAQAGNVSQALSMMDTVLAHHPNSAKAHFVEAELLAKQGRVSSAAAELHTAQRLEPGLPFANQQAVHNLEQRIAAPHSARAYGAPAKHGFPLGMLLMSVVLIAAIVFFVRATRRRMMPSVMPGSGPTAYGPGAPMPYGPTPMGGAPSSGLGSGILGGLATGAALGAGMVAGESLVHRLMDGNRAAPGGAFAAEPTTDWNALPDDNMGGNDFGVADGGSWDDGAASGGDWGDVDGGSDWS